MVRVLVVTKKTVFHDVGEEGEREAENVDAMQCVEPSLDIADC